jgi:hypothetical protein
MRLPRLTAVISRARAITGCHAWTGVRAAAAISQAALVDRISPPPIQFSTDPVSKSPHSEQKMILQKRLLHIGLLIAALVIPALSPAKDQHPLGVLTTRIPLARQSGNYQFALYPSNGTAPFTWTVRGLAGSGLRAGSDGLISGTPKRLGTYNLTVTVKDSSVPQQKAESLLALTVYEGGLPGAIPQHFFGLHVHSTGSDWPSVSTQVNPFGVVRLWDDGTAWQNVEKTQGSPDWSLLDTYVKLAQANGVGVLYEVALTPTWASSDPQDTSCKYDPGSCDAPADWQTFDDFMTALVSRYTTTGVQTGCPTTNPQCNGVIRTYELWNEPFNPREWNPAQKIYNNDPVLTMQGFVKMTQDAQRIIKSIDPRAMVASPSGNYDFFSQYWATQGAVMNFDRVDLHAYPIHTYPVPEGMINQTRVVADLMATYHITSPLMNTEGSWSQWKPPTDDAQAAYAARYVLLEIAMGMKKSLWYMWTGLAALWNPNNNPGILTAGGVGYNQVAAWLIGAQMQSSGCLDKSGTFQPNIYQCIGLNGTYIVNLVRRQGYEGQVIWHVKTISSGGIDWTATTNYKVPRVFTQYMDLNGNVYPIIHSQVAVGASPILLQNKSMPGQNQGLDTELYSKPPIGDRDDRGFGP